MSGSSLDGLDIAIVEIKKETSKWNWNILKPKIVVYSDEWKEKLRMAPNLSGRSLIKLDTQYAILVSEMIQKYIDDENVDFDCIAFHGHTIFHFPKEKFTYQLGSSAVLSARLSKKVVGDFRASDVSLGGQGAPLMAILDKEMFSEYAANINLGGICNITAYTDEKSAAFDISPCNQLTNTIAEKEGMEYDKDGQLALAGSFNQEWYTALNNDEYFKMAYPKSMDNGYVENNFLTKIKQSSLSSQDLAFTACQFIADKIKDSIEILQKEGYFTEHNSKSILISGGGGFHPVLRKCLESNIASLQLEAIFPSDDILNYKEILLMGFMAYLRLNDEHNVLSQFTGSTRNTISGGIYHA